MASMPGDSADSGQLGRVRGRAQGLRTCPRYARGGRVRRPGARCPRMVGRVASTPLPAATGRREPVIVQDPCHLRHVQRRTYRVRTVLSRYVEVVELDDEGLCCGAGGAYSALQPELAGQIRRSQTRIRPSGRSSARVRRSWPAATRAARCTSPQPGSRPSSDGSGCEGDLVSSYDELADRLEGIAEELGDLSIDVLRDALRTGAQRRPEADKKLLQARRAVDKAVHVLRALEHGDQSSGDDSGD